MKKVTRGLLCSLIVLFLFSCSTESDKTNSIEDQILELIERSSLDVNVLILNGIHNDEIVHSIEDGFEYAFSNKSPGDEICRGTGYSYARCVKDAMESGLCLMTYQDGNEFVAIELECPPSIE